MKWGKIETFMDITEQGKTTKTSFHLSVVKHRKGLASVTIAGELKLCSASQHQYYQQQLSGHRVTQ